MLQESSGVLPEKHVMETPVLLPQANIVVPRHRTRLYLIGKVLDQMAGVTQSSIRLPLLRRIVSMPCRFLLSSKHSTAVNEFFNPIMSQSPLSSLQRIDESMSRRNDETTKR